MAKTRAQKEAMLQELDQNFKAKKAVIVDYRGLSVFEMEELRNLLEQKGIKFGVIKNTLAKIALKNSDIAIGNEILTKPLAIAFSDDEVTPAKEIKNYSREHEKLEILGGIIEKEFVPVTTINSLALLPSREESYAKLVGSIAAPISGMVNVLAGNLRGLASILAQYRDSKSS